MNRGKRRVRIDREKREEGEGRPENKVHQSYLSNCQKGQKERKTGRPKKVTFIKSENQRRVLS